MNTYKIKVFLLLAFIAIFTIFYSFHINNKTDRINQELNNSLRDLKIHYSLSLDYFYTDVKTLHKKITNDQKFIALMKKANQTSSPEQLAILRKQLYDHYISFYKRINQRGFLQFQFMFPDNITFLRVHKPKKFGDDLTNIRYSYKYVNETKKVITGFEQGKTIHSIRYVFPLFDENKAHLGAVELSLSTAYLQERLINSNKLHTNFIVDKNIFEAKKWKQDGLSAKYITSVENDNYLSTITSHNNTKQRELEKEYLKDIKDEIAQNMKTNHPFNVYVEHGDTVKVISFLPIRNIKEKKIVAYLVAHSDSAVVYLILNDSELITYTIFIILLIIFYFIYQMLINKEKLKLEVEEKTKELQLLNENLQDKIKEEVIKSTKAQEQVFKSEKMAAMGEMIGNIAHQWRQPLSVISTAATGLQISKEYNTLTDDLFEKSCNSINDHAQYLSKTIDDFRNFIKGDRYKVPFNLKENISSFLSLVDGSIKTNHINLELDIDHNITLESYPNELIQCFLNIFNNAKDELKKTDTEKYFFITAKEENDTVIISLKDNAGGIQEDILSKIFEPYFTTKHQSQGTGLGLSMTYNLIVEGMCGSIEVKNTTYRYNNEEFQGAEFLITLPKLLN